MVLAFTLLAVSPSPFNSLLYSVVTRKLLTHAPNSKGLSGLGPAAGLGSRLGCGPNGVVPVAVPVVFGERDGLELGVGDLDAFGVHVGVVGRLDRQPFLGGGR